MLLESSKTHAYLCDSILDYIDALYRSDQTSLIFLAVVSLPSLHTECLPSSREAPVKLDLSSLLPATFNMHCVLKGCFCSVKAQIGKLNLQKPYLEAEMELTRALVLAAHGGFHSQWSRRLLPS